MKWILLKSVHESAVHLCMYDEVTLICNTVWCRRQGETEDICHRACVWQRLCSVGWDYWLWRQAVTLTHTLPLVTVCNHFLFSCCASFCLPVLRGSHSRVVSLLWRAISTSPQHSLVSLRPLDTCILWHLPLQLGAWFVDNALLTNHSGGLISALLYHGANTLKPSPVVLWSVCL